MGYRHFKKVVIMSAIVWVFFVLCLVDLVVLFLCEPENISRVKQLPGMIHEKAGDAGKFLSDQIDEIFRHDYHADKEDLSRPKQPETYHDVVKRYVMAHSPRYAFLNLLFDRHDIIKISPKPLRLNVKTFDDKQTFETFDPTDYLRANQTVREWAGTSGMRARRMQKIAKDAPRFLDDDEINDMYFMCGPDMPAEEFLKLWRSIEKRVCSDMSVDGFPFHAAVIIYWSCPGSKGRQRSYNLDEALAIAGLA